MIPIMPRQTTDDDNRPMGLKLARTNFFNFQKKEPLKSSPIKEDDRQSVRSSASPTLPARSPFRIRDSQVSARKSSQQAKVEEPNIYHSSLSSSTSSITTLDDDLSQELENMWKIRSPTKHVKSEVHQQDLFLQLLVSQAMIDAREYKVMSFEEIEHLKERRDKLKIKVRNSASKLELDKKIQETSHSLSQLASNRQSVLLTRDEAQEADRKVEELTRQLKELKTEEIQTQYRILEHTAGVLCHGLEQLEKRSSPSPQMRSDLEDITQTLLSILKKHNVHHSTTTDTLSLLASLEQHLRQPPSGPPSHPSEDPEAEVARLRALVASMETQLKQIQAQAAEFERQEEALKDEISRCREEVLRLRNEPLDDRGEAQQAALLDKTDREYERMRQEHDKLLSTCRDLEWLVKDKSRALEAREAHISQLEAELQHRIRPGAEFYEREAAWIEQSAAMEANFEGILKEFDRLTGTAMEFENDRANYERRIELLTREVKQLEGRLLEERAKNVRLGKTKDNTTTASLRKEFKKMISDIQIEHQRALETEAQEKKKLEKQLKDLKHEREMSRYERINKGVQTPLFIP
ncbi:hypothetical protein G6F62_008984 [Rhizopus arrhizus]|nr:hypothetical protein G6F62_008984 [Rhizopus arrhizus]KAG1374017.1 hypothetical protein G6F61_009687 [Rhizopus arrhizus]